MVGCVELIAEWPDTVQQSWSCRWTVLIREETIHRPALLPHPMEQQEESSPELELELELVLMLLLMLVLLVQESQLWKDFQFDTWIGSWTSAE